MRGIVRAEVERQRGAIKRRVSLWNIPEVAALPFIPPVARFFWSEREVKGIVECAGSGLRAYTIESIGSEIVCCVRDGECLQAIAIIQKVIICHILYEGETAQVETCQTGTVTEHTHHINHIRCVEPAHIEARQTGARKEHEFHVVHLLRVEPVHIEARQAGAISKHAIHAGHLLCVESAQIEALQTGAISEHEYHAGHLLRVEPAQIEALQTGAISEHEFHVSHLLRVEILDTCDGGEVAHITEPSNATGGAGIGEGRIEHHTRHGFYRSIPFRHVTS